MPYSTHTHRNRRFRTSARTPTVLAAAGLSASSCSPPGCGGSSSPSVAHLSSGKAPEPASSEGGGSSPDSTASTEQKMVAFAKCMRSSGVPSFQEPHAGGTGSRYLSEPIRQRARSRRAEAKCQKFMGGGGLPGSGSDPPSVKTLARWLKISQCMRKHGVSGFPDPRTSMPSKPSPAGVGEIADREGAILLIPADGRPAVAGAHAGGGRVRVPCSPTTDGKVTAWGANC